jgi:hypothetical protein
MNNILSILIVLTLIPSLLLGQTIDSQFATPTNMTDAQLTKAKEFTHQGVKDRVYNEGCAKADGCKADESGFPIEQLIGKAYALLGVMTGSGMLPQLTAKAKVPSAGEGAKDTVAAPAKDAAATPAKDAAAKAEGKTDYCMIAAMAYETIGGMIQTNLQKKAEGTVAGAGDAQLQALVSLKETHKARKTTATLQSTIYGGVTTCYGVMAWKGDIALDWKYWAKLGGAATLTALYLKKRDKHAKAMDKVQAVIDSLPKTGDCNPWTGTSCFCKETTSKTVYPMEYQEVCVLNNGNFETPKLALGCGAVTDNKLQFDETCKCKATNTCYKANLKAFNSKLGLGANLMDEANKGFNMVNSGEYDQGKLDAYTTSAAAFANKVQAKMDPNSIPKVALDEDKKKVAGELSAYLPPSLANMAAAAPEKYSGGINNAASGTAEISKLPEAMKAKLADAISVGYTQGSGSSSAVAGQPEFSLPGFPGQKTEESGGTEVVSFAEQAVSKADVSNAPETPIFDIISNRYRRSGWEKLDRLEK